MDYANAVKSNKGEKEPTGEWTEDQDWSKVPEFNEITTDVEEKENNADSLLNAVQTFVKDIHNNQGNNNDNEKIQQISLNFSKNLEKYIGEIISSNTRNNVDVFEVNKQNIYNNNNTINIKIINKKIYFEGNKRKYGLILGTKGRTLQNIKNNFPKTNINIPNKENLSNTIVIEGKYAKEVLFEIMNIILNVDDV